MDKSTESVDAAYFQNTGQLSLARRVSSGARTATFEAFMRSQAPSSSTKILDVGASDDAGSETNMIEQLYPWGESIVAAGLSSGEVFEKQYPGIRHQQIEAGKPLPFQDKSFDIAWSNAVLEHVGGAADRAFFLRELGRVAQRLYIVVPNRWFPIEHHTILPFVHWNAAAFRWLMQRTDRPFWAEQRNLDFLSKSLILREWPLPVAPKISYSGLPLGPFSSNLVIECDLRSSH